MYACYLLVCGHLNEHLKLGFRRWPDNMILIFVTIYGTHSEAFVMCL